MPQLMFPFEIILSCSIACADPEGGYGVCPPGKSQVIWVSIEITHWTPPPSMEKVALPP